MQRILLTAATLAVLVYALVLGVKWLSPKIETDLTNRLTTELAQSGQLWADVEVSGREVTLLGQAPSAEAQEGARAAVARVFGIAKMADLTTLPGQVVSGTEVVSTTEPTEPKLSRAEQRALAATESAYSLTITKTGNALSISGSVPNETDKALLLRLAELHFPEAQLETSGISVTAIGAPAGWRSAAGSVLFNLTNLESAEAQLRGRAITISGTTLAADFATSAEEKIRATVPTLYKVRFEVATTAPIEAPTEILAEVEAVEAVTPSQVATVVSATSPEDAENADTLAAILGAINPAAAPEASPTIATPTSCATLAKVEREVLHFAFDKAVIRKHDAGRVSAVATELRACPTGKVQVQGYTDATGSKTYNQWLSEQRAEAAVRALLRQGAKAEQMTANGFGETTQFGPPRAENRRVMFKAE